MPAKSKSWFQEHGGGVVATVVGGILLALALSIASGIKDNGYEIRRLNERHDALLKEHQALAASVQGIKQSVLKLGLSKDPKSAEILGSLVVDQPTARGIELYRNGQFQQAESVWRQARKNGSKDAHLAIQAAGFGLPEQDPVHADFRIRKEPEPREEPVPKK